jgi:hypothetical protein
MGEMQQQQKQQQKSTRQMINKSSMIDKAAGKPAHCNVKEQLLDLRSITLEINYVKRCDKTPSHPPL